MQTTTSTTARQRRGTTALEFVLVLPFILLMGFGCLDLGRAVRHYSVMSNAASAGAQRAATTRFFGPYTRTAWETKIRDTVREELMILVAAGSPLMAFDIQIKTDGPPSAGTGNQRLSLPSTSISINYNFETTFRWPGLPRLISLHCETQMRQYR